MKVTLGPREAGMLMDGLLALGADWEDQDDPPTAEDFARRDRLMAKLRPIWQSRKVNP